MRRIHSHACSGRDDDEGFTLIELMVVVLIIAILIAIAIPTFLGARQRAQDRATQADLRNASDDAEDVLYGRRGLSRTTRLPDRPRSRRSSRVIGWKRSSRGTPATCAGR